LEEDAEERLLASDLVQRRNWGGNGAPFQEKKEKGEGLAFIAIGRGGARGRGSP
jgi:hypothetical protein